MGEMIKKTVLIVDDEPVMRDSLALCLKKYFRILKASDGKEAENILNVRDVDCLVTDMDMPNMNGAELIEVMKSNDHSAKVIVMTGYMSDEKESKLKTLGVNNLFMKPFSPLQMVEKIEEITGE